MTSKMLIQMYIITALLSGLIGQGKNINSHKTISQLTPPAVFCYIRKILAPPTPPSFFADCWINDSLSLEQISSRQTQAVIKLNFIKFKIAHF